MAGTALCDQCGKRLSEEDFENGLAYRDRADVFCAQCAAMYAKEEKARKKRETIEVAASKSRRKPSSKTARSRRKPTANTRAMPRASSVGRTTASIRRPQQDSTTTVFLIVAAAVAVVAAAVILVVLQSGNDSQSESPMPEGPTVVNPQDVTVPPQPPGPPTPPQPKPEEEVQPDQPRSLFAPTRKRRRGPQ